MSHHGIKNKYTIQFCGRFTPGKSHCHRARTAVCGPGLVALRHLKQRKWTVLEQIDGNHTTSLWVLWHGGREED